MIWQHECVATLDGDIKCWGACRPACGTGNDVKIGDQSGDMGSNLPAVDVGTDAAGQARAVSSGFRSTCALFNNGGVKCWGAGISGQLGYGDTADRYLPEQMGDNLPWVDLGGNITATAVETGWDFNCAILTGGNVKCWGAGKYLGVDSTVNRGDQPGEMGDNLPTVLLGQGRTAKQISLGRAHACAVLDNGSLKCWGERYMGRTGYGFPASNILVDGDRSGEMEGLGTVDVGTNRTVLQVSCGNQHTCVILDNLSLKCWGNSGSGRLGSRLHLGSANYAYYGSQGYTGDAIPVVQLGTGARALAVSCGNSHTCVLLSDQSIKCFGYGGYGRLGYESHANIGEVPGGMGDNLLRVDLGTNVSARCVFAGAAHTCAITTDNMIKCWGSNADGERGVESTTSAGHSAETMGDQPLAPNLH